MPSLRDLLRDLASPRGRWHDCPVSKWDGRAVTKAERWIDPDLRVLIDGSMVRLGDVPCFEACRDAWLTAKAQHCAFGWPEFVGFVREMAAIAPADVRGFKVAVRDPDRPFASDNVEWRRSGFE